MTTSDVKENMRPHEEHRSPNSARPRANHEQMMLNHGEDGDASLHIAASAPRRCHIREAQAHSAYVRKSRTFISCKDTRALACPSVESPINATRVPRGRRSPTLRQHSLQPLVTQQACQMTALRAQMGMVLNLWSNAPRAESARPNDAMHRTCAA